MRGYDQWKTAYPAEWDDELELVQWECDECGSSNETAPDPDYETKHTCPICETQQHINRYQDEEE